MKTEQRTVFVARDGRDFPTKAKCLAHERETAGEALVGLMPSQIEAVRRGDAPDLAEAFETFGYELRKARQATGKHKRRRAAEIAGDKPEPPLRQEPASAAEDDSTVGTEAERAEASE
jgi:hypothetical protein